MYCKKTCQGKQSYAPRASSSSKNIPSLHQGLAKLPSSMDNLISNVYSQNFKWWIVAVGFPKKDYLEDWEKIVDFIKWKHTVDPQNELWNL